MEKKIDEKKNMRVLVRVFGCHGDGLFINRCISMIFLKGNFSRIDFFWVVMETSLLLW